MRRNSRNPDNRCPGPKCHLASGPHRARWILRRWLSAAAMGKLVRKKRRALGEYEVSCLNLNRSNGDQFSIHWYTYQDAIQVPPFTNKLRFSNRIARPNSRTLSLLALGDASSNG